MKKQVIQFIKFGIVGCSNTVISYGVYSILTFIGIPYLLSSIIGFVISVLNSYFWNNRYVFKQNENEVRNPWLTLLKTFISYAGTGLLLSNIILVFFVEILNFSKYIAPLISLGITIPLNFIINKFWSFKTTKIGKEGEYGREKED